MATAGNAQPGAVEQPVDKGLKSGALGLVLTTVMGVASTAPAYSLAATLGFIVAVVGLGSPIVAVIAFIPIFLTSIGYSELNKADPDCGTTFTWATRAFGPKPRRRCHPNRRRSNPRLAAPAAQPPLTGDRMSKAPVPACQ